MPTWTYEARDAGGHLVRGEREAPDRQSALEALRAQGLFLTRLEANTRGSHGGKHGGRASAVRPPLAKPGGAVMAGGMPPAAPLRPREPQMRTETGSHVPNAPRATNMTATAASASPVSPSQGAYVAATTAPDTGSAVRAIPPLGQSATSFIPPQPLLQASSKDLSIFFNQLASLIHAGSSIGASLHTMAEGPTHPALRNASRQMAESVMNGGSVSVCMESFPGLFSPLVIGIVRAGEMGGTLEKSFLRLARYAERDYELQTAVKRETWYPKLLVVASIFIPAVVPLVLHGFGAFVRTVVPPVLIITLLFVLWFVWKKSSPFWTGADKVRLPIDELKLHIPLVSKITRGLASAKFCRAMGALYSAGVGPGESVRLSAKACGNKAIEERALRMIPRLEQGEPFTQCLTEVGKFNPLALQMMRIGEESGALDEQLDKAADFLEADAETAIKQAVPVLGILVFLCIAGYIGYTVAQFYLGYFNAVLDMGENMANGK